MELGRVFSKDSDGEPWKTLAKRVCAGLGVDAKGDAERQKIWCDGVKPEPDTFRAATLEAGAESGKAAGLCIHFGDYKIGSYAEGPHSIFVAFQDIETLIKPEYRDMFGGERVGDCLPDNLYE